MTTAALTAADLEEIDLFAELDAAERRRWAQAAEVRELADGDLINEQGEHAEGFVLLLAGRVRSVRVDDGRIEPVGTHVAPTWLGAIPLLSDNPVGVRNECDGPCRVALIRPEAFVDLVLSQRPVHKRILRRFGPVYDRITAIDRNRERLALLGTMSAGLAHELNNPAAAAKRAAGDLVEALDVVSATLGRFVDSGVEREDAAGLVRLHREILARAADRTSLDALDAADAEDALLELLEDLDVADGWRIAEPLAAAGADAAWVRAVARLAGPATDAALQWAAASLTAHGLAEQVRDSAERMSRLVAAVKGYAYMDRGDTQEVDLHDGLETTLVVLGHKLKHTAIEVRRDYDRALPKAMVHGGQLNQVWTNLLDNAIDALGERGTITIRTRRDGACALVEIEDDGPGIDPELRRRVFDPFVTTKPVGQGTGLGLDAARQIVAEGHRGSITVDSAPGRTTFHVWIPFSAPK